MNICGLGKPLSNRTLILLDGQTVLNSFFDFVLWEAIPVLPMKSTVSKSSKAVVQRCAAPTP